MTWTDIPPGMMYNDCFGWYMPGSPSDPFGRSIYTLYNMECLADKTLQIFPKFSKRELMSWPVKDLLHLLEIWEGFND